MPCKVLALCLLPILAFPSAAADVSVTPDADPRGNAPVRVGAMIGVLSVPRPVDAEVFVRIKDRFAFGISYSDLPNFVASPLLSAAGANSDTMTARLDDFSAFEADLRFMPFRSAFFVGASFGRQALKGAITESTVVGPQTATVDTTMRLTVTRRAIDHLNRREHQPAIVYLHPWELDVHQPKVRVGWLTKFRHSVNTGTTEGKLLHLLKDFRFAPARTILEKAGLLTRGETH